MSLGAFVSGAAQGVNFGLNLQEKVDAIKEKRKKKSREDEYAKVAADAIAGFMKEDGQQAEETQQNGTKNFDFKDYGLGGLPNTNANFAPASTVNVQGVNQYQVDAADNAKLGGMQPRRYATGGLVDVIPQDKDSFVNQVQQQPVQQGLSTVTEPQKQQTPKQKNIGAAWSKAFNAARDKAIDNGDFEIAQEYQNKGFAIRDRMFKETLPMAQQAFESTGNLDGFVKIYNDAHDDGAMITNHTRNSDGTYSLQVDIGGTPQSMTMTADQIKGFVYQMNDPAMRYKGEIEALNEKAKSLRKREDDKYASDLKIAEENNKPRSIGMGEKLVMPGLGVVLQGNEKPITEIELQQRAAQGDPLAIAVLKNQSQQKIYESTNSRAPDKQSLEERAFEQYVVNNPNGSYIDFKQQWDSAGKNSETDIIEETNMSPITDKDGNQMLDAYGEPMVRKTVEKKKRVAKPVSAVNDEMAKYQAALKAVGNNKAKIDKINAIAKKNGLIK